MTPAILNNFLTHLKNKYPVPYTIELDLNLTTGTGFFIPRKNGALLQVKCKDRDFPHSAATTLAHEYKHVLQHFVEKKDLGNYSKNVIHWNLEKEADDFADQEVKAYFPDYRKPTDEEIIMNYFRKTNQTPVVPFPA